MPYGNQMTREQMRALAAQIANGRPTFGSVGNYFTSGTGSITPSQLPEHYRQQLIQTNIDDSGTGIWNFADGGFRLPGGNERMTQLGDTGGVWDHRYVNDWNLVTYDPEMGLVTPWSNIVDQEDRSMTNFTRLGRVLIGSALGAGLMGASGAGGGFVPSDYGMAEGYAFGEGGLGSAGAGAGAATRPDSYWGMTADNAGAYATDAGGAGYDFTNPEYWTGDPTGNTFMNGLPRNVAVYPGTGGAGLAAHNLTGGLSGGLLGGAGLEETLGSFGSALGSGASSLGSWLVSNPLNALGLYQVGSGLLNRGGGGGGGGGGEKGGGGSFNPGTVSRGTFTPNPYTARQIANYQHVGRS